MLLSACVAMQTNTFRQASYFPPASYNFDENPLTDAKVALGRILFYDPLLSADSTISCASCHSSYNAFSHTDHKLSHGIHGEIGTRNAPALFNLAWKNTFMWDGAIHHLDVQALAPINNPIEMNMPTAALVDRLQQRVFYRALFFDAFGDSTITGQHMLQALGAFQVTLISDHSKYDSVQLGTAQFTEQEAAGYQLFKQYCNSCHTEPLFTNGGFANNGLTPDPVLHDTGRYRITGKAEDSLLFAIPSLRNLSYTYPYMHDGRFARLAQVLDHYASEKNISPTLAPQLNHAFPLSSNDKVDLIAFLLTLDDKQFVFNKAYQFPPELLPNSKTR